MKLFYYSPSDKLTSVSFEHCFCSFTSGSFWRQPTQGSNLYITI